MISNTAGKTSTRISVAMCTRNGAAFVSEQVSSILAQTFLPAEIIVSDDSSTDETVELIRALVEAHNSSEHNSPVTLRIIVNPVPLGVTKNFEQAINACSSAVIALSDQDDVWLPNKLEDLFEVLESSRALLVFSNAELVDGSLRTLGETAFGALQIRPKEEQELVKSDFKSVFLRRNLATGATILFRKELLDFATPFPASWLHDEWLAIVASFQDRVSKTDEVLTLYRQHETNQVGLRRRTLRHYIGRMIFPRTERNQILFNRALDLRDFVFLTMRDSPVLGIVEGKLEHERVRNTLPIARWARIIPVLREARTGRYSQFGLGFVDALRDIVQPV